MATRTFYPYEFLDSPLPLLVENVALDGREVRPPGEPDIDLRDEEAWKRLELRVSVTLPEAGRELVPAEERASPPWRVVVAVSCPETKLRRSVRLHSTSPRSWTGVLDLPRKDLRGTVGFAAHLVRSSSRPAALGFADRLGMRLACSAQWKILVDEVLGPVGGFLDGRWENFETSETTELRANPQATHYLDFQDPPRLYLNEAVKSFKTVMESTKRSGVEANFRNSLIDSLVQSVWPALILGALHRVKESGGDGGPDWAQLVLEEYGPLLAEAEAPDEQVRILLDELDDPTRAVRLLTKIQVTVQQRHVVRRSVERLLTHVISSEDS